MKGMVAVSRVSGDRKSVFRANSPVRSAPERRTRSRASMYVPWSCRRRRRIPWAWTFRTGRLLLWTYDDRRAARGMACEYESRRFKKRRSRTERKEPRKTGRGARKRRTAYVAATAATKTDVLRGSTFDQRVLSRHVVITRMFSLRYRTAAADERHHILGRRDGGAARILYVAFSSPNTFTSFPVFRQPMIGNRVVS